MDVIQEITDIVDKLNKIDEYDSTLVDELSKLDQKQQDLLHYIEFNKVNILWCYRMIKEILRVENEKELDLLHYVENNKISMLWCYRFVKKMKDIRIDRRKVKNDIDLCGEFSKHKNKLISKENRQFLIAELHKKIKNNSVPYKNRQYTEEEMQKVLKGM